MAPSRSGWLRPGGGYFPQRPGDERSGRQEEQEQGAVEDPNPEWDGRAWNMGKDKDHEMAAGTLFVGTEREVDCQTKCQETHALGEEFGSNHYTSSFPNNPCSWPSCFVVFTYYFPCLGICLSLKGHHRIQQLMDGIFSVIDEDHRALVFKEVLKKDIGRGKQFVWNSWQTLCNVPMYQCDDQGCQSCEEKDVNKNFCLTAVKN
ncbi:hypothetical protein KIL84_001867 [Mauremys mutica]|uniref:Uncharacterized protein n=1 Tax=Mauremys mutica TaxID=74926 RepID=A0A9D3XJ87_9SAUR|nr:hypothetical protein KIL84_001867 [Mauremys mutica]